MSNDLTSSAIAKNWSNHAPELAHWAWSRLVNRTDAWGGYNAIADRTKVITRPDGTTGPLGATTTRPVRAKRGQVFLTQGILERHFRATAPEYVIGLHTTSQSNTCRWGAIEVDHHGEGSTPADVNLRAAIAWFDRLQHLGFHPLLTDSNGKGGFHLLTIFAEPVPSARVYDFLRWLAGDHAKHGLVVHPETFPKQRIIGQGRYGNWLRLPGRHHTREHWSRVWDGMRWLGGAEAVAFIKALGGDSASHIPTDATVPVVRPAMAPTPSRSVSAAAGPGLTGRIRAYMEKLPTGLGEGQHRDDYAYRFACFLARDLALPDAEVLTWLAEWDSKQLVRKGKSRLAEILKNARLYGQHVLGCGLGIPAKKHSHHRRVILQSRVECR